MSYSDSVRMSTAILLVLVLLSLSMFSVVHCDPVIISDGMMIKFYDFSLFFKLLLLLFS